MVNNQQFLVDYNNQHNVGTTPGSQLHIITRSIPFLLFHSIEFLPATLRVCAVGLVASQGTLQSPAQTECNKFIANNPDERQLVGQARKQEGKLVTTTTGQSAGGEIPGPKTNVISFY